MRLINVDTLQLEEFIGDKIPPYAILSHTWGVEEVSYDDWLQPDIAKGKQGYTKIVSMCNVTKKHYDLQYAWVDTNCIDKRSSADLSESINSMFKWYKESVVCIVYLIDVDVDFATQHAQGYTSRDTQRQISSSRWFTRGWTLQELLAPNDMEFYSKDWVHLTDRGHLAPLISACTGIPHEVLSNPSSLYDYPAAQRMSWASKRQATRVEDLAYSLMGLFDINMPLLYGEGSKAFKRLQEEILKNSNDLSILAWRMDEFLHAKPENNDFIHPLAPSPRNFDWVPDRLLRSFFVENCVSVQPLPEQEVHTSITNAGILLSAHVIPTQYRSQFIMVLPFQRLDYSQCLCLMVVSTDGLRFHRSRTFPYPQFFQLNTIMRLNRSRVYLAIPGATDSSLVHTLPPGATDIMHQHGRYGLEKRVVLAVFGNPVARWCSYKPWLGRKFLNREKSITLWPLLEFRPPSSFVYVIQLTTKPLDGNRLFYLTLGYRLLQTSKSILQTATTGPNFNLGWDAINRPEDVQQMKRAMGSLDMYENSPMAGSLYEDDGQGVWTARLTETDPTEDCASDAGDEESFKSWGRHVEIEMPQWRTGPNEYYAGVPLVTIRLPLKQRRQPGTDYS